MKKLIEHEIFAEAVEKEVNMERLERIGYPNGMGYRSYADCNEYIISHVDYYNDPEFVEAFKLTNALTERWDYYGIDFSIYIYLKDNRIAGGHIFKYRDTTMTSHFRPTGYEMEPTQQEIRIARRVLGYITEKTE